jgi:hypothetical protein
MANPYQGDDEDPFSGVRNKEGAVKRAGLAKSAKLSTFGAAFNAARKAGDKTFMFKGKKYTTEMAKPKAQSDTDIITKGATKLYEERKGPTTSDLDRIATKQREEDKGPSEATVKRMSDEDNKRRSQAGEFGTFKKGGRVNENKAMKKMGRGMAKAEMQKVASKVVKGHEKRMHKKFEGGGSVSARADGCAVRGKTKCRIV